jgi:hypothetical protein
MKVMAGMEFWIAAANVGDVYDSPSRYNAWLKNTLHSWFVE